MINILVHSYLVSLCTKYTIIKQLFLTNSPTDVPMYIDNSQVYGYMSIPLSPTATLQDEIEYFSHMLQEFMSTFAFENFICNIEILYEYK